MPESSENNGSLKNVRPIMGKRRGRFLKMKPGPLRRVVIFVIAVVILLILGTIISRVWTETLWFQEMGHANVFWTPIWARVVVGIVFAAIFFGILFGNLMLARRLSPRLLPMKSEADNDVFELVRRRRWPVWLMLVAALALSVFLGIGYAARWETVFLFFGRSNFGYSDPIFHKDASFYVFTLPFWRMLVSFTGVVLLFTFIGTGLVYLFDRAIVVTKSRRISLAPHVKAHLSVILAIAVLAKGADYMIQRWSVNLSQNGVVQGASATDVHARLPVLLMLAIASVVAAVIFIANIRYRGWKLPAVAIGIMLVMWLFAGELYPYAFQHVRVLPNELSAERQYIKNNIVSTRTAFGLSKITTEKIAADTSLTAQNSAQYNGTLTNVRLWEPRPALSAFAQLQELRLYYAFKDVDVDRYKINGQYREVLISGRELDQSLLQSTSQTWVNQHLQFTHGYGFVMSPVNESGGDGLPAFTVQNIPPTTNTDLKITRPEIYYGELGNDYVLVKTKAQGGTPPEFDYPSGDSNVFTTYKGTGGVSIGSFARKVAFSFRFGTPKILFSNSLTKDSVIMYRRDISSRVKALAPFLTFDKDPYLVLRDNGSLVWVWDAYTTTNNFPYSQPQQNGVNYIRNSIKVVIDAYNGNVTFYQIDSKDPIANAWGKIYKGLFTPGDKMPADIKAHLRYPEDIYSIQANVLTTYHMTDPQIFYNKEDVWVIPTESNGQQQVQVAPYYQMISLASEAKAEFTLVQPLSTIKQNMSSILVARQDGEDYGKLVLIDMPKDKLVFGTSQVEANISKEPTISAQLTLWDQAGSQVIRGNLLAVPIGQSIMYFEPLYLQATENPIPSLTEVIVVYGDQIVMEPTLDQALNKIFSGQGSTTNSTGSSSGTGGGAGSTTTTTAPSGSTTTTTPSTTTTLSKNVSVLITQANQYYQAAVAAQKRGDWAEYGKQLQLLQQVLQQLEALQK